MDRSTRFRKSANRLFFKDAEVGEGSSASRLNSCCSQFGQVVKTTKVVAKQHKEVADSLSKCTHKDDNAAIRDVSGRASELLHIWANSQLTFSENLERSIMQLSRVKELGRLAKADRHQLRTLGDREEKLKRDVRRAERWRKGGDVLLLQLQLRETTTLREEAEKRLQENDAEREVVKMFRYQQSMQQLSAAYMRLGADCSAIFGCLHELTALIPSISTEDVRRMVYQGAPQSRQRVADLRRTLGVGDDSRSREPRRRFSEPATTRHRPGHHQLPYNPHVSPPPPYSPRTPTDETDDSGLVASMQTRLNLCSPMSDRRQSSGPRLYPVLPASSP